MPPTRMNDQDVINQQEWSRDENWTWWRYRSERDTRLWVPKRNRMGWTLNFARRGSYWTMLGLCIVPLGFLLLLALLQIAR